MRLNTNEYMCLLALMCRGIVATVLLVPGRDPYALDFRMHVNPQMSKVQGRILQAPTLSYRDGKPVCNSLSISSLLGRTQGTAKGIT